MKITPGHTESKRQAWRLVCRGLVRTHYPRLRAVNEASLILITTSEENNEMMRNQSNLTQNRIRSSNRIC